MKRFHSCCRNLEVTLAGAVMALLVGNTHLSVAQTKALVPLQGQTTQQMAADQQQCAQQATTQTGYNPSTPPATAGKPVAGQRVAGAARGAAAGKVISNTTKQTETDSAMEAGAKVGAMAGGAQQRQARREQRSQTQQQQGQATAYSNAVNSCLQSRGYALQ